MAPRYARGVRCVRCAHVDPDWVQQCTQCGGSVETVELLQAPDACGPHDDLVVIDRLDESEYDPDVHGYFWDAHPENLN